MPDFYTSNIQDDDEIEITDLDPQCDGSNTSLSLVLLRFVQKIPLFANTRARSTALALLTCVIMLLFLVQPGLPAIPRQASSTSALARFNSTPVRSTLSMLNASSANVVTWIKISNGTIIERQARFGVVVWRDCKPRRWHIPRKYQIPPIIICR
jgi:hypothetical protein